MCQGKEKVENRCTMKYLFMV